MSEYIITCDEETASWIGNDVDSMKPIVRCRDCKHYHEAGVASYTPFCEWMNDADVTPDGFCAWGEREDGDAR